MVELITSCSRQKNPTVISPGILEYSRALEIFRAKLCHTLMLGPLPDEAVPDIDREETFEVSDVIS